MGVAWSEKTKNALIATDNAITDFVVKGWQTWTPEKIVAAWTNFVNLETADSEALGYGKRSWTQNQTRGYRDYPYFNGGSTAFLTAMNKNDLALRERIYLDMGTLVNYFAPWDWEENQPKPRGYVGADGLAKTAPINKIRFRVLDEQATIESKVAENQSAIVKEKVDAIAQSLGFDVSRGTAENLKAVFSRNIFVILGGAGLLIGVIGFVVFRGKK
jgi:hypothetical protein